MYREVIPDHMLVKKASTNVGPAAEIGVIK